MNTKSLLAWMLLGVVAWASPLSAETPQGKTYLDLFHGFSLVAPDGAERSDERSATQLVSWRMRDEKTNAILWTLTASKADGVVADDLEGFSKSLAQTLKDKELFTVEACQVGKIAERPSIDLKGKVAGKQAWWQRQVWVEGYPTPGTKKPGKSFIVLRITGPAGSSDAMDAAMTDLLKTLKIIDAKEAVAQRGKNLKAGAEFLQTIEPTDLARVKQSDPIYLLTHNNGKVVHGSVTVRQTATTEQTSKLEIREDGFFDAGDNRMCRAIIKMSSEKDRSLDTYQENIQLSSANFTSTFTQDKWKITGEVSRGAGKAQRTSKLIPPEIRGCYLPKAFQNALPQLLDLKKPFTYAFAVYNTVNNAFDVCTVTVVGPAKIEKDGKIVQGHQIVIQSAEDGQPFHWYVDDSGRVLRIVPSEKVVIDAVDKKTFLKAFPKAAEMIGKD